MSNLALQNFLIESGYFVGIYPQELGWELTLPKHLFGNRPINKERKVTYMYSDGLLGVVQNVPGEYPIASMVEMPEHVVRPAVLSDITIRVFTDSYRTEAVIRFDQDGKPTKKKFREASIFSPNEESLKKEDVLFELMAAMALNPSIDLNPFIAQDKEGVEILARTLAGKLVEN